MRLWDRLSKLEEQVEKFNKEKLQEHCTHGSVIRLDHRYSSSIQSGFYTMGTCLSCEKQLFDEDLKKALKHFGYIKEEKKENA